MKVLRIAKSVNLALAGTLAGNEFGTWAAVHPALGNLGPEERIRAEQEVTRRYAAIMPFWMGSTVASGILAALLSRGSRGSRSTLLGALCFLAMLVSTRLGNVPINDRTLEIDPKRDQEEFAQLRERWDQLHTLRVALNVSGLVFLLFGTLREDRP